VLPIAYARDMAPHRRDPPALPPMPPKLLASLRALGLDLTEPATAALFLDGVRVAEDAIASEARWMRARCSTAPRRG
jgi:hypothetical protein